MDGPQVSGLRADARRNTDRLLEAARAALAEKGLGMTTRDLASRAGVGLGTVHRRINSLSDVITEVLIESIEHMRSLAEHALKDDDIRTGFTAFAEDYVRLRASSCGLNAALAGTADGRLAEPTAALAAAVRKLVKRAQRAGVVRAELRWQDVPFALAAAVPPDHTIGLVATDGQWERTLAIVMAGLLT